MATKKKLLQAAAGSAGGAGLNVEEVFSTYLWDGDGTTNRDITNNIDLSGEGGMVWIKNRDGGDQHWIADSQRSFSEGLSTNETSIYSGYTNRVSSFRSNGFRIGSAAEVNASNGDSYTSWSFRKAPKFFDVVTYTGNGTAGRTISHNLGVKPGFIIFKRLDVAEYWITYHRSITATDFMYLDRTDAAASTSVYFNNTEPTDSVITLGSHRRVNASGSPMIAYVFAHNDGDGDFGPTGDQDIIKCGSYTTDANEDATIDLGFEPQWVLFKRTDSAVGGAWNLYDNMRGLQGDFVSQAAVLVPNLSSAEDATTNRIAITPTGFKIDNYGANRDYIYIAIRRGPMAVPESATDVFAMDVGDGTSSPNFISNFPVDASLLGAKSGADKWYLASRLTGTEYLRPDRTNAAGSAPRYGDFDMMDAWWDGALPSDYQAWMWRRAPNFFDVVAWEGSGTSGYEYVDHNLGVTPEMIWFKNRDSSATPRGNWYVYHKDLANSNGYVYLNSTSAEATDYPGWATGSFPFSDTRFVVQKSRLSYSGESYIAYLFASVDGVSKVGSFTGNGSSTGDSQDIDCGFSSGARFVLVKAIGAPGAWFLFDTERGIVAGNDSHLSLNSTAAEDTSRDLIDPLNSGFTINYHSDWGNQLNGNGQTYIYYAIA